MLFDRLINHHIYQQDAGDDSGGGGGADSGGGGDSSSDSGSSGEFPGGGSGGNLDSSNELISSEDVLKQGRELAIGGVPLQIGSLYDALARLRSIAHGSTAEILPQVMEQISNLRSQYSGASQAIARKLGYAGGGQVQRAQQGLLARAGQQYGGLISKGQQAGFAQLINTTSGIQPALSGAARPPNVSVNTKPQDLTLQGTGLASLVSTAQQLGQYYANRNPSTNQNLFDYPQASEAGPLPSFEPIT